MAENTPNLRLLKKDPVIDGADTFNIKIMLNDNWDKLDSAVANKETPEGAQAKADAAEAAAKDYADQKVGAIEIPTDFIPTSEKGVPGGVASLDNNGQVPGAQLPAMDYIPTSDVGAAGGVARQDDLVAHTGAAAPHTGHATKADLDAHKAETMPHLFKDGTKTYRWGLAVIDGVVNMVYEEVV